MWLLCLSSLFHWSFLAVPDLVSVSRWAIQRNHKLLADFRCFIPAGDLNFFGGDTSFHEPKWRHGLRELVALLFLKLFPVASEKVEERLPVGDTQGEGAQEASQAEDGEESAPPEQ